MLHENSFLQSNADHVLYVVPPPALIPQWFTIPSAVFKQPSIYVTRLKRDCGQKAHFSVRVLGGTLEKLLAGTLSRTARKEASMVGCPMHHPQTTLKG